MKFVWPITVAARSKASTLFACSNIGIVGSNPTQGIYVCVVLSVGSGLATSWSHVQRVLPCIRLRNLKKRPRPNKGMLSDRERDEICFFLHHGFLLKELSFSSSYIYILTAYERFWKFNDSAVSLLTRQAGTRFSILWRSYTTFLITVAFISPMLRTGDMQRWRLLSEVSWELPSSASFFPLV
jgi:hypothetical protein